MSKGKGNKSESKRMGLRGTKKLSRGEETINKTERQPLNGRRRLQIVYPRKGWYKNIEEIHITQYQTPKHPNQKMGGRPNSFPEKTCRRPTGTRRDAQITTTGEMSSQLTPVGMPIIEEDNKGQVLARLRREGALRCCWRKLNVKIAAKENSMEAPQNT